MQQRPGPHGDPDELEDLRFLAGYDASRYPRPSVATDVVLLSVRDGQLVTLLLRRPEPPQVGRWSLPGSFVGIKESVDDAAQRVLEHKVGLRGVFIEQLYTFGAVDRDPRTRVISVVHYALVEAARLDAAVTARADGDLCLAALTLDATGPARATGPDGTALELAFDHGEILRVAVERIRGKVAYAPIGFELLPPAFTLTDLRAVHEAILGTPRNKDSFRRTVLGQGLVVPTGQRATGVGHRPPELYRFAGRHGTEAR